MLPGVPAPASCLVATQNVDFGTNGLLGANVDSTGIVSVTCIPGNAYTVALSNGLTDTGPTARTLGWQLVSYGLYKDSNRTQPWGDPATPGSTVPGTGTGRIEFDCLRSSDVTDYALAWRI